MSVSVPPMTDVKFGHREKFTVWSNGEELFVRIGEKNYQINEREGKLLVVGSDVKAVAYGSKLALLIGE
jgi:hypothetical protein